MSPVDELVALARASSAKLGNTRLIAIDGPAASGKSTLARAAARELKGRVLHTDDLLGGWHGLADLDGVVRSALLPLLEGDEGYYRRYDWEAGEFRETRRVLPVPYLVVEGVSAGNTALSSWVSVLTWVECPDPAERLRRGLERDGEALRPQWESWMHDEEQMFVREQTRQRADLVVTT